MLAPASDVNMDMSKVRKVIEVLKEAKSPAPLECIARRASLDNPLELLEWMEEKGLVRRVEFLGWSPSLYPMFEAVPKAEITEEY